MRNNHHHNNTPLSPILPTITTTTILLLVLLSLLSPFLLTPTLAVRRRTECDDWANAGECVANPNYMLEHCRQSCEQHERRTQQDIGHIQSFFDLRARDIDQTPISFERFRGKVTIVTNVASHCGYTESHYRELVELHKSLLTSSSNNNDKVEILAFPCNQFGFQEPDDLAQIKAFARSKGVEFTMMDKIDVNGLDAHPVYKYLKRTAGPHQIGWNFATYYVIDPEGKNIRAFNSVNPSQLQTVALELLDEL